MARSALITGGTGGLGSAVTQSFLDAGWRVVVPLYDDAERGRVSPQQIAEVVRFLCDDGAGVVSGAHVPVYGGA